MPNINVCAQAWHGTTGESFNFINTQSNICTVSSSGSGTWPFVQASPISVPAQPQGGSPGSVACQIKTGLANGNYGYDVDGCPKIGGGVPATLTIP